MSRYAIWNKTDSVITPVGEIFTPEQWMERYPVAKILDIVCGGGVINGSFFGVYDQMIDSYKSQGCDFINCETQQDHLDAIEKYENSLSSLPDDFVSDEARIADALEDLIVLREMESM